MATVTAKSFGRSFRREIRNLARIIKAETHRVNVISGSERESVIKCRLKLQACVGFAGMIKIDRKQVANRVDDKIVQVYLF